MAVVKYRRNVAGVAQTPIGGVAAVAVLSDWSNADGWVAIVELTIAGHGANSANLYYRREVFEWTDGAGAPAALGAMVAATTLIEDAAWTAIVALNGNNVEVQMGGAAFEVVNFSWSGTITLQQVV